MTSNKMTLGFAVAMAFAAVQCSAFFISYPKSRAYSTALLVDDYEDDYAEDNFFDDFGGELLGDDNGGGQADVSDMLRRQISTIQDTQDRTEAQTQANWQSGQWRTRGFAIETAATTDDDGATKVTVTSLTLLADMIVAVGRSDGSICVVRLGTDESMVTFEEQNYITALDNEEFIVRATTELKRRDDVPVDGTSPDLFDMLHHLTPDQSMHASPISRMVSIMDEENHCAYLYSSASADGMLQVHRIDLDDDSVSHVQSRDMHKTPIVAMERFGYNQILTVDKSGLAAIWSVDGSPGYSYEVLLDLEEEGEVTCATVDNEAGIVYFGTSSGTVIVYNHNMEFCRKFMAHINSPISTMATGGAGNLSGGISRVLFTGGASDGLVKRWELMSREGSIEHWPRLSTQRIPGAVHVLDHSDEYAVGDEKPSKISAIVVRPGNDMSIVTAANDVLRVFDAADGQVQHFMAGLEFADGEARLILTNALLITNGMGKNVCVHDFAILGESDDSETGYDLEW